MTPREIPAHYDRPVGYYDDGQCLAAFGHIRGCGRNTWCPRARKHFDLGTVAPDGRPAIIKRVATSGKCIEWLFNRDWLREMFPEPAPRPMTAIEEILAAKPQQGRFELEVGA